MILDTSAIVAVIEGEPEADHFVALMLEAPRVRMSASTYVETGVVIDSRNDPVLSQSLDTLLEELSVIIEPVTTEQAAIARGAYRDFGKGRSHPAQLNFETALPTHSRSPAAIHCCSRARTSPTPTSSRLPKTSVVMPFRPHAHAPRHRRRAHLPR